MTLGGGDFDGMRRTHEYGYSVARQTERRALAEGKGRASMHRNRGGTRWFQRLLRRFRNPTTAYECICPTPPAPGERHRLDCELRNDGFT